MVNPKDSRYILQHLANERTYLNWIRSTITVAGVFLVILRIVTHVYTPIQHQAVEELKNICFVVLSFSLFSTIYATSSYLKKRAMINQNPSHAARSSVTLTIGAVLLLVCFIVFLLVRA